MYHLGRNQAQEHIGRGTKTSGIREDLIAALLLRVVHNGLCFIADADVMAAFDIGGIPFLQDCRERRLPQRNRTGLCQRRTSHE